MWASLPLFVGGVVPESSGSMAGLRWRGVQGLAKLGIAERAEEEDCSLAGSWALLLATGEASDWEWTTCLP